MTSAVTVVQSVCTECGWQSPGAVEKCPLCSGRMRSLDTNSSGGENQESINTHTFSLSTLFLVMTLISVGMGVMVAAPGLGIPLVIISVPALFRTSAASRRTKPVNVKWTNSERVAAFMGSLGIMFLIAIAGVVAFQIACWSSCWGVAMLGGGENSAFITGIWVGGGAGVLAIIWLIWRTWPRRTI